MSKKIKMIGVMLKVPLKLSWRRKRVGITWRQAIEMGIAYKESSIENIRAMLNKDIKKVKKIELPETPGANA